VTMMVEVSIQVTDNLMVYFHEFVNENGCSIFSLSLSHRKYGG
jgi:hypothetical protein